MSRRRRYHKKRFSWIKFFLGLILISLIAVGAVFAYTYTKFQRSFEKAYKPEVVEQIEEKRQEEVEVGHDPISILIMGKDTGEFGREDVGRSDVMVVLTVNPNTNKTTMTSIPRDTYTEIVGKGINDKINHAVAFGGVSMAVNTVQKLLDLPIDYFVSLDMYGFIHLVDAMGGLNITPTQSFEQEGSYFEAGQPQLMDGTTVLRYVRNRYDTGGDYSRQDRSRQILEAMADKLLNLSSVQNLPTLLSILEQYVETNLRFDDLQTLGGNVYALSRNIEILQLAGQGEMLDGIYYEMLDETTLNEVISKMKANLDL